MNVWRIYRRSNTTEATPWAPDMDIEGVSIGPEDKAKGSPKAGDMICRNPRHPRDQWLVNAEYFADNYIAVDSEAAVEGADA